MATLAKFEDRKPNLANRNTEKPMSFARSRPAMSRQTDSNFLNASCEGLCEKDNLPSKKDWKNSCMGRSNLSNNSGDMCMALLENFLRFWVPLGNFVNAFNHCFVFKFELMTEGSSQQGRDRLREEEITAEINSPNNQSDVTDTVPHPHTPHKP